jgi:hypothetical protein
MVWYGRRLLVGGGLLVLAAASTWAQPPAESAPADMAELREESMGPDDTWPFPPGRGGGPGSRFLERLGWGAQIFQTLPADRGPLTPGEQEELLEFARERLPRLYELLSRIRQHHPERFQMAIEEHAPRLRHLKRIYERSPELGDVVRRHAQNMLETQRLVRELRRTRAGEESPQHDTLRNMVLENIALEAEALGVLADELNSQRERLINQRVMELTEQDAEGSGLPDPLRLLLDEYRATPDESQRESIRARMRVMVGRHLAMASDRLRDRAARMRTDQESEADRQVERLLRGGGRRFGPRGGPPYSGTD